MEVQCPRDWEERRVGRIDYRNACYEGEKIQRKRDGFGVLLTDEAQMLIADWHLNNVEGRYCYITHEMVAYGTVIGGELTGFNCLRKAQATLYAHFQQNRIHGKAVLVRGNSCCTMQYNRGVLGQRMPEKTFTESSLKQILQKEYVDAPLNLHQCLVEMVASCKDSELNFKHIEKSKFENYFGFIDKSSLAKGIGMVIRNNELLNCGTFEEGELHGLGRQYKGQSYQDGTYKKGVLHSIWVNHQPLNNEFTLTINGNQELQRGDPIKVIREIHKEIHLRSTYFQNDLVVISRLLALPIQDVFQVQLNSKSERSSRRQPSPPASQNSRVFRRTGEQTSFAEIMKPKKLFPEHEEPSEEVSGSSPIKHVNTFQPIESFHFEDIQPNYGRQSLLKSSAVGLFGKRSSKILIEEEDNKPTVRLDMPFKTITPPMTPQSEKSPPKKKIPVPIPSTKSLRPAARQQLLSKDTATMVKQMEEQEKRKRIDLDRIYRETGIVRTKKLAR